VITASVNTCLHKGQRRSFGGRSSSIDFDEETFFSSACRAICANASAFFSILSTYNSLKNIPKLFY
jgi:hypothetical protein